MTFNIFRTDIDKEKYVIVTYFLKSLTSLKDASEALSLGQSIGNIFIRSHYETDELFERHSCIVLATEKSLLKRKKGIVKIAFPVLNTHWQTELSHFLCQIVGGQLDITNIVSCIVKDIEFPESVKKYFFGPKFGIKGIREFTKVDNKCLIGGIIKPKIFDDAQMLLEMTKEMVSGGINWIKEDECISSGIPFCPLEVRVPLIADYIKDKNVIYHFAINADPAHILDRVKLVHKLAGDTTVGVHVNFWCGLGVYKSIRELDLPIFLHFQQSGSKILTNKQHNFHIDFKVVVKLISMSGCDTGHIGGWGAYSEESEDELKDIIKIANNENMMSTISCGVHPGLVQALIKRFGNDVILNSGGSIHGFPNGSKEGTMALVQARDGEIEAEQYKIAINKWGLVE